MDAVAWRWSSAQQTHRGKRRHRNEDAVLSRTSAGLWAVADGMGGHHAGDVASQAVTGALAGLPLHGSLADRVDRVEAALVGVNQRLRAMAAGLGVGVTMGSTVVVLLASARAAVALWAGDSRLYRWRGGRLEQVTRDHTPVSDLLDAGAISEAEAEAADSHVITRAVGAQPWLVLDVAPLEVVPGDVYLLCSDGAYRDLDRATVTGLLGGGAVDTIAERLLDHCLDGPATDNVSLVVVRAEAM